MSGFIHVRVCDSVTQQSELKNSTHCGKSMIVPIDRLLESDRNIDKVILF